MEKHNKNTKTVKNNNSKVKQNSQKTVKKSIPSVRKPIEKIENNADEKNKTNNKKNKIIWLVIAAFSVILLLVASFTLDDKNYKEEPNVLKYVDTTDASKNMKSWYTDVSSGEVVITVIASSTCPHCQALKPDITDIAKKNNIKLYFFESDQISETDNNILVSAFDLKDFSGSVPYMFIVKEQEFISYKIGYDESKENLTSYLKELGIM